MLLVGPRRGERRRPSDATTMLVSGRTEGLTDNHQGSGMEVGGLGQRRTEAPIAVGVSPSRGRRPLKLRPGQTPTPVHRHDEGCPVRKRRAGFFRGACERAAEYLRTSSGVDRCDARQERCVGTDRSWPRLLLWALSCAGLCVSLIMRADDLDQHAPRLAAREMAPERSSDSPDHVFGLTQHGAEFGDLSAQGPPQF